ncbi:class I SAM-dependent methyltransferase [Pleurocapsa sp. FMAR1]|uniref:class I SAM-dependent methyltransferase n=1 Tax=Pleurocapsa sp. FMAR1 TaxID=3040204 RepID=UPI0029C76B4A|nr:class I SAM-dependent methyltransferase [Pleurocapsa sp. FMAR1]
MTTSNERIERERQFHNRRYIDDNQRQQKVGKFYSITGSITRAYQQKILQNSKNSKVIEYGCGKGSYAFKIAKYEAQLVTGIDISPVAIETAIQQAATENIKGNIGFEIMNAEHLEFAEGSYDLICGSGILHHLNLASAIDSITRILQPEGKAIFLEPLGHNFLINLYRRLTPSIRSQDEHPLSETDLKAIKRNFEQTQIHYFYLTSLFACFFVGKPGFKSLLRCCEFIDSILLKLPVIKSQAWMVLIELKRPIKQDNLSI